MNNKPLEPVSPQAMLSFNEASAEIIKEVVNRSMLVAEEIEQHGSDAKNLITSGIEFTARMLTAAMQTGAPQLLDDQATWALDRLPHDGVSPMHIVKRLKYFATVVEEKLPAEYAAEVNGYIAYLGSRFDALINSN